MTKEDYIYLRCSCGWLVDRRLDRDPDTLKTCSECGLKADFEITADAAHVKTWRDSPES